MHEASKAMNRRGTVLNNKLFAGNGIDIGAGPDCIDKFGYKAYNWDLKDGDAQFLESVKDNYCDFVHSSHCLEHMNSVRIAMKNWIRVCKPGGYIVVIIPDEQLYEHNMWPSKFNWDHKWSFRIWSKDTLHKKHINVVDMLTWHPGVEIISITRNEEGFDFSLPKTVDQTFSETGPECSIEFILRKL